jgi:DNA-directed RNA polymerase subunit K/omega
MIKSMFSVIRAHTSRTSSGQMESRVVISNADGKHLTITPRENRRSSLFLTRFEVARIIGVRAQQIASGNVYQEDPVQTLHNEDEDDGLHSDGRSNASASSPFQGPFGRSRFPRHGSSTCGEDRHRLVNMFDVAERAKNPLSLAVDPVMIAKHELVAKQIRMIVERRWPNVEEPEVIPVSELEVDESWLDLKY